MSEIDRNGTRGNESDCMCFLACVPFEKEGGKERGREKEECDRDKGWTREGKKEVAGGDTRVSKDVMRERNGENEMRNVRERASERELMRVRSERNERELEREREDEMRGR